MMAGKLCNRWVSLAFAAALVTSVAARGLKLGAGPPEAARAQAGDDVIAISGQAVPLKKGVAEGVLVVPVVALVDEDCQPLAVIRPGLPMDRSLISGGWLRGVRRRAAPPLVTGDPAATIRCAIPPEAAAVSLRYIGPPVKDHKATLSVNGSEVEFPVNAGNHLVLFPLARSGGKFQLADRPPIENLWDIRSIPPGPDFEPCTVEIDTEGENSPLKAGKYTVHIQYEERPDGERGKRRPVQAMLNGVDITGYDGYVIEVFAKSPGFVSSGLKDSQNFSWSGPGARLEPNKWTRIAVPFEEHRNFTVAGDGVLKLSEIKRLTVSARGVRSRLDEFWVRTPEFYVGDPPEGVQVARREGDAGFFRGNCVALVSPEKRKAPFFDGVSIQGMTRQGSAVWLATDRGLMKASIKQPGLELASYGMESGVVDDDVHAVLVDGDDIWLATTNGVSRFDGSEFHNFTRDDGLLPGPAMALAADKDNIWIGMARGVARINKQTGKLDAWKRKGGWAPESTGGQGVPIQEGRGVYADSILATADGSVWHGAAGIDRTNDRGRTRHYHGSTIRTVAMLPGNDDDHLIWVTSRGVNIINKADAEPDAAIGIGRRGGFIGTARSAKTVCAARDGQNTVWLGYSDGLGWCDLKRKATYWSPRMSVSLGALMPQCLLPVDDTLWVGTDNGLVILDKKDAGKPWRYLDYECLPELRAAGIVINEDEDDDCALEMGEQKVFIDETNGADGSRASLAMEFLLSRNPNDTASLSQHFYYADVRGYRGLTFYARTSDKTRDFHLDVVCIPAGARKAARRRQVYRTTLHITPEWRQYFVPFALLQPIATGKPPVAGKASYVSDVVLSRKVADFGCPMDHGSLWIDHFGWYTDDESPTRTAKLPRER